MTTLEEKYCAHYRVSPDRFSTAVFWRCLHRRTWLLVPVLLLFDRDYFAPDRELIRGIGRLESADGLGDELAHFYSHSGNYRFARRRLRLRISVRKLSNVVRVLLPGRPPGKETVDTRFPV